MTVAVIVKVFDGVALAADSATTLALPGGSAQVWNNANKVFHLHRDHAIGAMTWGTGSVGSASIETLVKDFRRRLMGRDADHLDDELGDEFSVEEVAQRLAALVYDEVYLPSGANEAETPGLVVAGYGHDRRAAEAWRIAPGTKSARPTVERVIGADQAGWLAFAQDTPTRRLFTGFDPDLPGVLEALLEPNEWSKIRQVFEGGVFSRTPAAAPMPFADALKLARYLVDVTVGYSRFLLGPDTVGGPVEVAGITRHEGFKWVSRKHYYTAELNPEEVGHAY